MEATSDSRTRRPWVVALGLPVLAGVIGWILTGATTSVASCESGGSVGLPAAAGYALAVVPPLVTAADGWRTRNHWLRVTAATLTSAALTLLLIFIATQIWWVSHNCLGSITS